MSRPPRIKKERWNIFSNYIKNKSKDIFKYLKNRKQAWYSLLFLLICLGIILAGIWPGENNFEGSLVVKKIDFTYNGQSDKLFINSINGIKRLEVKGRRTLRLSGKFSSSSPELNQKLTKRNTLTIELPSNESQWTIAPADSKLKNNLKLTKLRLPPQTTIESLSYDSYKNRLDFLLKPVDVAGKPENDNLFINLGDQPLQIIFSTSYKLPELDLQASSESSNEIKFIYQPNIPNLSLYINTETYLSIDLPDPSKVDYEKWLWEDFAVKNMRFQESVTTGNDEDDIKKSTIIKGEIHMGEQELKIESNQFVIIGEPGIHHLRYLAIIPPKTTKEVELRINGENVEISEPAEGIEARIAGKAKGIQVGIDPRSPVNSIQSSYLASLGLRNDLIISVIPFVFGAMVTVFTWLVNDFLGHQTGQGAGGRTP